MRSRRIFAVHLGAEDIVGGVFGLGATGRLILQRFVHEPLAESGSKESDWADAVARGLGRIAARERLAGPVAVALPGRMTLTKFIRTPAVGSEKHDEVLAFEAARNIPQPLDEVVWDAQVFAETKGELELLIAAIRRRAIDAIADGCAAAGFQVESAVPAAFALARGFFPGWPEFREPVAVVSIEGLETHIATCSDGRIAARTCSLGVSEIFATVGAELKLERPQAQKTVRAWSHARSAAPEQAREDHVVQRALAAFTHRLHGEIARTIAHQCRQLGAESVTAIHVAADETLAAALTAGLAAKLPVPAQRYDALRNIELSADARAAEAERAGPRLGCAIGLAMALCEAAGPAINLVPESALRATVWRRQWPWMLAAAGLALGALVPPIVRYERLAASNERQITDIEAQLRPLRMLHARNAENLERLAAVRREIAALRPAYEARSSWLELLSDLQMRLGQVEDVWLDRMQLVRGDVADANARTPQPLKLSLSGWVLDIENPHARVSRRSLDRVKQLMERMGQSSFVAAVEDERFENGEPGRLRFDVTVVLNSHRPL